MDSRLTGEPEPERTGERRSLLERAGLALVAGLIAVLFGGFATAAWLEGELFLAVMSGIGALMTVWAAASTLRRG